MLFEKKPPLEILSCPVCKSTGTVGFRTCPNCHGLSMGRAVRGLFLYFDHPLTRYHLSLERGRRILNKVRLITFALLGLNFWVWCGFIIYRSRLFEDLIQNPAGWISFYKNFTAPALILFWLGVLSFTYVFYRSVREKEFKGVVEHHKYGPHKEPERLVAKSWPEVFKIFRGKRHNIAGAFTNEALAVLGDGYRLADTRNQSAYLAAHLFHALLSANRISNIFIRLGISPQAVQDAAAVFFQKRPEGDKYNSGIMPLPGTGLLQIIFSAYEEAYGAHQDYVSVTELFLSVIREETSLQEILYDFGIDKNKLGNAIEWARIKERLYRQYLALRRASRHRSKTGMDRAMTALATNFLNRFGRDLTILAQFGHLDPCVAREKEYEEIFQVISGGVENVLLTGDHGVGKRSIIEGLAQKMVEDDVPDRLKDKRLVELSVSSLLAGTTPAGAVERLSVIMQEISRARNVILFINNIQEVVGVSAGEGKSSLDVADTLAEYLKRGNFLTIATATSESFAQEITHTALGDVFSKVEIKEMDENQAIQVLESKVGLTEYKQNVFFSYDALEKAVSLSARFMHDLHLPGSALEVMNEAAVLTNNKKGQNALVTGEETAQVISEKTKIPVTAVTADESAKLLKLEEEMHQRMIGQDEAVDIVANALRRARASIRSTKRPIANFLFLGPTGVGKTEMAKTIAGVYFGGEDKMIRLDMSEYQDKTSIYRLIGAPGEKGTGLLTEAVRRAPFALLLLDEIEKADKDILNLFLQVMDDGRLTDSAGRAVDFTNVILIATSNAGTAYVQEQIRAGVTGDEIKNKLLHGELKQYFRPEFLNRFDGIVLFKPLEREEIKRVAGLMLKRVAKDLEDRGVELVVEDAALEFLAETGFDQDFGARPMRRAIQEKVENHLAELLLSGRLKRKDKVIIGEGGEIKISNDQ